MSMRASKRAIAAAFRADQAITALVPGSQIYATERATIPVLPAIEILAVETALDADGGPMVRHQLYAECTVSAATEDDADLALDALVAAVRRRLRDAMHEGEPVPLDEGGGFVVVELMGTRWSVSATDASHILRAAGISLAVQVDE